ncbi:MAG: FG-GAP repeat protein [Limisphaerales bacterium]
MKSVSRTVFLCCLWATLVFANNSFAALLYDTETLLPDPPPIFDNGDEFGTSVDISGSNIMIGAPAPFVFGIGRVFIESLTGPGTNVAIQEILSVGSGGPGFSVAIDGDRAITGIPFPTGHFDFTGDVAFFQRIGGTWVLQGFASETNALGKQVAISGTTAVALNDCSTFSGCTPHVNIYVQTGTNWIQQAELPGDGPIAISGDTLLIGPAIYVRTGTTWNALAQPLTGPTNFASEAIDGNIAVVGTGTSAFIFRNISGNWILQQQIFPSDSITGFGRSVDIKGTRIVVGANEAAYVFDLSGGTWAQLQKLLAVAGPTIEPSGFGFSVAIGERGIVVGAPFSVQLTPSGGGFGSAGAAYLFTSSVVPVSIASASASPSVLWPPNHKLVPVTVSVTTAGSPGTCKIVSVTSNQPINGTGDGNTSPDWVITGDLTVLLRAERAGNIKTDRVYTITVECADAFGNTARANVLVTVPHDQGNK